MFRNFLFFTDPKKLGTKQFLNYLRMHIKKQKGTYKRSLLATFSRTVPFCEMTVKKQEKKFFLLDTATAGEIFYPLFFDQER